MTNRSLFFSGSGQNQESRLRVPVDSAGAAVNVGAGKFCVEWWMKALPGDNAQPTAGFRSPGQTDAFDDDWIYGNIIFDRDIYDYNAPDWGISVHRDGTAGVVRFGTGGNYGQFDNTEHTLQGHTDVLDGQWHHVAVVRNSVSGLKKIFVDGVLDAKSARGTSTADISYPVGRPLSSACSGLPYGPLCIWEPYLVIGAEKHDADPVLYPSFRGYLDEIRVWSSARSKAKIQANMYTTLTTMPPNLAAYWRLDDGTGVARPQDETGNVPTVDMEQPLVWSDTEHAPLAGYAAPASPTPSASVTPTLRPTFTPTGLATATSPPTATPTATPTDTPAPASSPTSTPTATRTATPTRTPTTTPTQTRTQTPTRTPTALPGTPTQTPTRTLTATPTRTFTQVPTATPAGDRTPPSIPTGLAASVVSCSEVDLTWNASTDTGGSGLLGYNVYRDGLFVVQILAPATSMPDTGLSASTTYSYTVAAVDNAGNQSSASTAANATTQQCPTLNPELLGFVPAVGTGKDVVYDPTSRYALVASIEFGLAVVDVTVPTAPVAVADANPPFYGEHIAVSGSFAVVAGGSTGTHVVDLTNPLAPVTRGTIPGTARGVAMNGQYAYLLLVVPGNPAHVDLTVVDISAPDSPTIRSQLTVNAFSGIAVQGTFVYLAAGSSGLQIVDVSVPTNPHVVSTLATPGAASTIRVRNGYAYVGTDTSVAVIDVSTPSLPTLTGSLATASGTAIAVKGTKVYAVGATLFKVIDVSVPSVPVLLSSMYALGAQGLDTTGSYVLLASQEVDAATNRGGLYVVDVSVPIAPVVLGNVYGAFNNWGVAADGTIAVATGNSLGLRVVDVSIPSKPRTVGSLTGTMHAVAMEGHFAYVVQIVPGNPAHTDLITVDVSSLPAPIVRGRVAASASGIDVLGPFVYLAAGSGLQIVDVSDATAPTIIKTVTTASAPTAVAVTAAGYAYLATSTAIVAIDVRTPVQAAIVGSLSLSAPTAIAALGNRVYVLGNNQLNIVDVSSPTTPTLLSASSSTAQSVAVTGNTVLLAVPGINHFDPNGGVNVVDVSNPSQPSLVAHVIVPGATRSVTTANGVVYAGDAAGTVDVISLTP